MSSQDLRQTERRFVEAAKLLDAVQQKKMFVERERLRAQLTLQELETPSKSVYQSVGKMFIIVPVDDVKKELNESITKADAQIKDIEVKK